jgi:hypothetical protein
MPIANVDRNVGTQYPLVGFQTFALSQLTAGSGTAALKLPSGARVIGGELVVTEVFNSTSTDTIAVGDSGSATRYLGATNVRATGRTALVPTGYKNTAPTDLLLTWASGGGTPTTGAGYIMVMYIIDGRANEVVPI